MGSRLIQDPAYWTAKLRLRAEFFCGEYFYNPIYNAIFLYFDLSKNITSFNEASITDKFSYPYRSYSYDRDMNPLT